MMVAAGKLTDNRAHEGSRIAEEHQGLVEIVKRVVNSCKSRAHPRLITITVRTLSTSRIGMP